MPHNGGDGTTAAVFLRRRRRCRDLQRDRVALLPAGAEDEILRAVSGRRPQAPRNGCECSSSSTGAALGPTPAAGHPRLRMRHVPFQIGPIERDAWLRCMHTAVASIDSGTLDDEHRRELLEYLEMAAHSLVNSAF